MNGLSIPPSASASGKRAHRLAREDLEGLRKHLDEFCLDSNFMSIMSIVKTKPGLRFSQDDRQTLIRPADSLATSVAQLCDAGTRMLNAQSTPTRKGLMIHIVAPLVPVFAVFSAILKSWLRLILCCRTRNRSFSQRWCWDQVYMLKGFRSLVTMTIVLALVFWVPAIRNWKFVPVGFFPSGLFGKWVSVSIGKWYGR